jgi:hypothetical protein
MKSENVSNPTIRFQQQKKPRGESDDFNFDHILEKRKHDESNDQTN